MNVKSENNAIRCAHNELRSHVDYLCAKDLEASHGVTREEAYRALELMSALIAKLEPATRVGAKEGKSSWTAKHK